MSQFQSSEHNQFIRSPHFQRNAKLTPGHCQAVSVRANKPWPHFSQYPGWLTGTHDWEFGDTEEEATTFLAKVAAAGFDPEPGAPTAGGLTRYGISNGFVIGDVRFSTQRYRTATWETSGVALVGREGDPPTELVPWSYSFKETYHQKSGALILELGENAGGEWAHNVLGEDGILSSSGDLVNGWKDYPEATVPQDYLYNWQLGISTEAGCSAHLTVATNEATLQIFLTDGIELTFRIILSDIYLLTDCFTDCEGDLLDSVDLSDLSIDYGEIENTTATTMQWNYNYRVFWEHGVGVPLAIVYQLGDAFGGHATAVAEAVQYGPGLAPLEGEDDPVLDFDTVVMSKARLGLADQDAARYEEEQELPQGSSVGPPPADDGDNGSFAESTVCTLTYATGAEKMLTPADLTSFATGRATLQRACAADVFCTP